ncbi:hypothetical protein ABZV58_28895 [Nocardia sp. NPDC004654]|uniref:hypothetical protein n=1 Tax=Nocardia sp. NPDC004654 TaxID=3154776 RepID=UPI0033B35047
MSSGTAVAYSTVRRGLRCARVVIVFDGGENWSYWARRALYLASRTWGGAGFVLVPHQDGKVAPALLRACRTYDPDYVVTFRRELVDFEYFLPGHLQVTVDGSPLTGRARWVALAEDNVWLETHTASDKQARDQIAAVCSPYKYASANGSHDAVRQFGQRPEDFPDVNRMPGLAVVNCAQCPPNWGGLLGVAVASHAGLVDAPNPAAVEPDVDEDMLRRLTHWLMGSGSLPPESLARLPLDGASLSDIGRAWDYTTSGLAGVVETRDSSQTVLVVVGDAAEDFALARLWQHTYMHGIWLPSTLGADRDDLPSAVMTGLIKIFGSARSGQGTVTVTSTSLPAEDLSRVLARFRAAGGQYPVEGADEIGQAVSAEELVWPRRNTVHLGIHEQFDDPLNVPTEVDASGTRTMLTPLPPPLLQDQLLARHPDLTWHVDITWPDNRSVLGGGLTARELLTPTSGLPVTLARSSRYGTSYPSKRYDLVLSGIPAVNALPRPKLRNLSLADWVDAKLAQHDLTSRLSSAGHKTAQLARMFADRHAVMDLFAGPLLPALRKMDAEGKSSKICYPQEEGVRIRAHYGVLNFSAFTAASPESSEEQVRRDLDKALRAGVIRRGLVLRCSVCTEVQFQPIDRIGQRWTCERCDSGNDLDQPAWNRPLQEPRWFYDLHPVGRQLLNDHGEVPIALAAHLARTGGAQSAYQDLAEIELVRDGKAKVELDLIAYRDGVLVIGEAKSAAQLSRKSKKERAQEIRKKCQAAVWLEADELVFATSAAKWTPGTEADIREVAAEFDWPHIGPPVIRMLAGLDFPGPATSKVLSL